MQDLNVCTDKIKKLILLKFFELFQISLLLGINVEYTNDYVI